MSGFYFRGVSWLCSHLSSNFVHSCCWHISCFLLKRDFGLWEKSWMDEPINVAFARVPSWSMHSFVHANFISHFVIENSRTRTQENCLRHEIANVFFEKKTHPQIEKTRTSLPTTNPKQIEKTRTSLLAAHLKQIEKPWTRAGHRATHPMTSKTRQKPRWSLVGCCLLAKTRWPVFAFCATYFPAHAIN